MRPARVLSLIAVVGADTRRRDTFVLHTEYHPVGDQKTGQTRFAHRISSCWRPEDGTHSFCTQNITLSETRRWDKFVLHTEYHAVGDQKMGHICFAHSIMLFRVLASSGSSCARTVLRFSIKFGCISAKERGGPGVKPGPGELENGTLFN